MILAAEELPVDLDHGVVRVNHDHSLGTFRFSLDPRD